MICEVLTLNELLIDIAIFMLAYILFIYVNMSIISYGFRIDVREMYFGKKQKHEDYIDFLSLIITMSFISTLALIIIAIYNRVNK